MKMKKTFKAMKFNIGNNPDISKMIQKRLFKLGYRWTEYDLVTKFKKATHLYTNTGGFISYGDTSTYFDNAPHQEIDIEWMKPLQRKTVEVGDKTYYEDELAEALSKIKEVDDF